MKLIHSIFDNTISLLHCFSLILEHYLENDSFIVVVNSEIKLNIPVLRLNNTTDISTTNLFGRKFDFYLVDCSDLSFEDFMNSFGSQPSFSSTSHFVFFCKTFKHETLLLLKRFEILNMVFLNTSSGNISTFYPYRERFFQHFDMGLKVVGHCDMNNKENNHRLMQLFPNKIPEKWRSSTLNIFHPYAPPYCMGTKDELGIELDTQILVLERMGMIPNFTKFYLPEVGQEQVIKRMLRGDYCDYIIGVSFSAPYFQSTVPYIYDDLMWYVPSAKKSPNWKYLFRILNKRAWLCWMVSSVSAMASLYISDIFLYGESRITNFLEKYWIFYRLFLEQSVSFRTKYSTDTILLSIFIFGTFMMDLVYKSRFFHSLTAVHYEDELDSLEQVMDRGMKIGFLDWHTRLFEDNNRLVSYLKNNFQSCNMQANCSDQAALKKDLAVLRPRIKMTYWTKKYTDAKGRSLLKSIENPVADLFWAAAFFPGHPLFRRINQYIMYFLQFGIMDKIMSKYSGEGHGNSVFPETHRLSLGHVEVPIIFWMFGMIFGFVILVAERKYKSFG